MVNGLTCIRLRLLLIVTGWGLSTTAKGRNGIRRRGALMIMGSTGLVSGQGILGGSCSVVEMCFVTNLIPGARALVI